MFGCSLSCSQAEFPVSQTRILPPPNISEHFRKKFLSRKKIRREEKRNRKATAEDVRERDESERERAREREREKESASESSRMFVSVSLEY